MSDFLKKIAADVVSSPRVGSRSAPLRIQTSDGYISFPQRPAADAQTESAAHPELTSDPDWQFFEEASNMLDQMDRNRLLHR